MVHDNVLRDIFERGGFPLRLVVLVDEHGAHALVEIMASLLIFKNTEMGSQIFRILLGQNSVYNMHKIRANAFERPNDNDDGDKEICG